MRLDITGRHVDITAPLRQLIEKRLARLERVLNDAAVSAASHPHAKRSTGYRTEIAVHTRGDHVLRGNGEGTVWPVSVRQATDKIEQQAQTLKGKWNGAQTQGRRRARRHVGAARRDRRRAAPRRPRDPLRGQADVDRGRGAARSTAARKRSSCSATPTPKRSASCTVARTATSR